MYPVVKSVRSDDNYRLKVVFDNGETRTLDMSKYLDFGVFKRLKDPKVFRKVHVSFDTIEWDSGVDIDPEFVYAKSIKD